MKVTYTSQQMTEVTGLPSRKLQFWVAQGILAPVGASRSGVPFRFFWSEIENARLLLELDKRHIQSSELLKFSTKFREIVTLDEDGFLARDSALMETAVSYIHGDGPAIVSMRGYGSGKGLPIQPQPATAPDRPVAKLDADDQNKFWCYIAYRLAKDKRLNSSWIVWIDKDSENPRIVPRLFQGQQLVDGNPWTVYAEFGEKDRGSGIIVDLRVLSD